MSQEDQDRIFLCHASEDKRQVLSFYEKLKTAGFNPWLDKKDLLPGQQWGREIPRALKKSRFIIIFFSKFSVSKRGYVQREFKLALDTLEEIPGDQIFIIPVRLNECDIPEDFRHIHYVDLYESGGLDLVMKVLHSHIVLPNRFTDPRDGRIYKTVKLNDLTWMAENLNFNVGEGCWFYENDPENGEKYGRLYTWEAAMKACPPGWRLPTDEEWKSLANAFGGYYDFGEMKDVGDPKKAYAALKEGGKSGFSARLGGYRNSNGGFDGLGNWGYHWSATERGASNAWVYNFSRRNGELGRNYYDKSVGLFCRCVQGS